MISVMLRQLPEKLVKLGEVNTHPAVINHPVTGRLCLFIGNGYVKRVNGFSGIQRTGPQNRQ